VERRELLILAAAAVLALAAAGLLMLVLQGQAENRGLRAENAILKQNLSAVRYELGETRSSLEEKMGDIARDEAQIGNLTAALSARLADIEELREQLNESASELEETRGALEEAEEDIARIRDEAEEMDERINESIAWFRDNAELPSGLKTDRYVRLVEKHCEDGGTLNLACASYLMGEELEFTYKDDPGADRLYSIDEIVQRKGGDCEDYALFFKALLARFRDDDLGMEAWEGGGGRYVVYEDASSGRYWYYDDAEGRTIGNTRTDNPYAVCYFYDTEGDTRIGHCIIMLSGREIETPDDITNENLDGAALFEPQDGSYMGAVGDEFTVCEDGDSDCDGRDYALAFIITGSDLFEFSEGEWSYYAGREGEVQDLLSGLARIETGAG
jgi:hypothetical protein